uniref:Uncharacterized protein n=1 Tax=Rhizophora mucronata TaxID=61149 RepID=A0A2P2N6T1_RHIMU
MMSVFAMKKINAIHLTIGQMNFFCCQ